jgi:hypothetical protein
MRLASALAMEARKLDAKSATDQFAWHYAFFTHLVYRRVPASAGQLFDITQAVHAVRGHRDPIQVADEILRTWPFDVSERGPG